MHFVREVWRNFLRMAKLNIHLNAEVKYLMLNLKHSNRHGIVW